MNLINIYNKHSVLNIKNIMSKVSINYNFRRELSSPLFELGSSLVIPSYERNSHIIDGTIECSELTYNEINFLIEDILLKRKITCSSKDFEITFFKIINVELIPEPYRINFLSEEVEAVRKNRKEDYII